MIVLMFMLPLEKIGNLVAHYCMSYKKEHTIKELKKGKEKKFSSLI